ncbi:MAG: LptF/LptG family permease [Planctomycetes bacterium]|nr:LptF/LptG family permease [Planctomycetota bacterium]MBT4028014.1 LptF/LptG family permease [Planctomycetota bacterium]MBT4561096.1 LptF/LptG family permease [Planctomycetota bacterium]MBT5100652.1 LptF/LptG family permease [Planctomycetota bacterium]MBT7012290.1 LptF/LptG family permease [Planctomycetota bacterium]
MVSLLSPIRRFVPLYDRYILRAFLSHWLVVAAAFLCMFTGLDVLAKSDDFVAAADQFGAAQADAFRYYLLNVPFLLFQFAPYITLLAGLGSVLSMQKRNEWLPALTGGRSSFRAFLPMFLAAAFLAGGVSLLREVFIPTYGAEREALSARLFQQKDWQPRDLWARGEMGERLHAFRFRPAPTPRLLGLEVYGPSGSGDSLLKAATATWKDGKWMLADGFSSTRAGNQEVEQWAAPGLTPSDLTRAWFMQNEPLELSVQDYAAIRRVEPDHRLAATLYWAGLATPWVHLVLLLLGLPFALRFERRSSMEGIAVGLGLCALFFVFEFLLRDLGGRGLLSPQLAGLSPLLLFAALSLRVQRHLPT